MFFNLLWGDQCGPTKKINRKCRAKTGFTRSGGDMKDVILEALKKHAFNAQLTEVPEQITPNELLEGSLQLSRGCSYDMVTEENWKVKVSDCYPRGCGRTWRIRGNHRFNEDQKEFLKWAFQVGVNNKSQKLTSHIAAGAMKLVGTSEGEKMFPTEEYMKASADGKPKFKRKHLIMHYEIKSYFGQRSSKNKVSDDN